MSTCGHPTRDGTCSYPEGYGTDTDSGKCHLHVDQPESCAKPDCDRSDLKARGLCRKHYQRGVYHGTWGDADRVKLKNDGDCRVEGCNRDAHIRRYCSMHYHRVKRNGDPGGVERLRSEPDKMALTPSDWSRETVAWFAGLFEGEGHVGASVRDSGYVHLRARVSMTDEDVVREIGEKIGGHVRGPYTPGRGNRKPYWVWAAEADRAYAVLAAIFPFMGERRSQDIKDSIATWAGG